MHHMTDIIDEEMRTVVRYLNSKGYATTWSCQGGEGHYVEMPTLRVAIVDEIDGLGYMQKVAATLQNGRFYAFKIAVVEVYDEPLEPPIYTYIEVVFQNKSGMKV